MQVWKRFSQFEQTYGDLASILKVVVFILIYKLVLRDYLKASWTSFLLCTSDIVFVKAVYFNAKMPSNPYLFYLCGNASSNWQPVCFIYYLFLSPIYTSLWSWSMYYLLLYIAIYWLSVTTNFSWCVSFLTVLNLFRLNRGEKKLLLELVKMEKHQLRVHYMMLYHGTASWIFGHAHQRI